ncbi:hypothetical protein [Salegentibacter maritimus]|uniref:hypothetical protein n=1 Tax=Salegentibacter maritimus TaxID=2794347 RepID=UPI0018E4B78B|nr:hypothetical protein [Salegentibacter maritimus]MBI6118368.1 hypothetical protein [Salegentibacter maritimus]
MNIAFTTILLFIILAPGFIARKTYNSSKLSIRVLNKNVVNELTWSIIPALTLHIILIAIVHNFTSYYIDFNQLGNLILGIKDSKELTNSFEKIGEFKYAIFSYNFILFSFSFLVGFGFRKLVRKTKLDISIRYFRFSNKWHYIFSGECLDFPDVPDKYEEITDKIINVLCSVNGKNVLYTGDYFNYYIDNNGDLEAIHLRNPIRRYLEDDNADKSAYYSIETRYLVIPNSDILNINFRYFSMVEVNKDELNGKYKIIEIPKEQTK